MENNTALQELIKWLGEHYYHIRKEDALRHVTELLETEKQQIIKAYQTAQLEMVNIVFDYIGHKIIIPKDDIEDAEEYYNNTFNKIGNPDLSDNQKHY